MPFSDGVLGVEMVVIQEVCQRGDRVFCRRLRGRSFRDILMVCFFEVHLIYSEHVETYA